MSWVLLLLYLQTVISTIRKGGMSLILLQLLLHTVVSAFGTGGMSRILLLLFHIRVSIMTKTSTMEVNTACN